MKHDAKIKKLLVILSPDLIHADKPKQSPLMQRAVSLAKITSCELELFHVSYDSALEHQLWPSGADIEHERKKLADRDATLLAEMATRLKDEHIAVRYEARWDSSRTDAILQKIDQARPDIVMKQAREHSYVLGITSNIDWDLARRSPAHVWLVNDKVEVVDRIMAAIGNQFGDPGDITTAVDYDLLRMASLIGDTFKAAIYPVNAFLVPEPHGLVAGATGTVVPVTSVDEQNQLRNQIIKKHSGCVEAFAQYFNIAKDHVRVCEGHPNKVIPEVAKSISADLIVMGADSISRLERLVSSVTVEPVMADTNTDIVIVRERALARVPNAIKNPLYGVPNYDLEDAIAKPAATFDSPLAVASLSEISLELRSRILQAWEYDIRAQMTEENEGGPTRDIDINALDEITSAREMLEEKQEKPDKGHTELHAVDG